MLKDTFEPLPQGGGFFIFAEVDLIINISLSHILYKVNLRHLS